jgi:catechol 2,3-dioxygenase-like lactoylglutathione lyase family enzyme
MFSHIMLGVNDLESSKRFYDALLGQLGIAPGVANKNRFFYRSPTGVFAISTPINGETASSGNGATTGFLAQSTDQVNAAHAAGLAAGGVDRGRAGLARRLHVSGLSARPRRQQDLPGLSPREGLIQAD